VVGAVWGQARLFQVTAYRLWNYWWLQISSQWTSVSTYHYSLHGDTCKTLGIGQVKVKSLCLTWHKAMKMYRDVGYSSTRILNLGSRWRLSSQFHPLAALDPGTHWIGDLGWSQSWSLCAGKQKVPAYARNWTLVIQPIAYWFGYPASSIGEVVNYNHS